MKIINIKKLMTLSAVFALTFSLVACGDDKKVDEKEVAERSNALDSVEKDETTEANIVKTMEEKGYSVIDASTEGKIYTFSKTSGDKVVLEYTGAEHDEFTFIYRKDFGNDVNPTNFILTRVYKNTKYVISVDKDDPNMVRVEKEVYKDCSTSECVTDGESEISFEHYGYNIEKNTLTPKSDFTASINLNDIEEDLEIYFEELVKVYE